MKYDIIIVGAGASGLAAAYQAAVLRPQLNILVLEKESFPGRKLSAAGNGKCNLTNMEFHPDCYHSQNRTFIKEWVLEHSYEEIPAFFNTLGVLLYQKNGYYYPVSNQGKQVTSLLYEKSRILGVDYAFHTRVTGIQPVLTGQQPFYQINAVSKNQAQVSFQTSHLILAAGGAAAPKLGGCRDGYALAEKLKLKCNPVYPVLSPVYVDDALLSLTKGVRLDGTVTLNRKDGTTIKESGQIQFNEKSLSGIVIMNLSCYLNTLSDEERKGYLHIDVIPEVSWNGLKEFILSQIQVFPDEPMELMLNGILPNPFVRYIIKRLKFNENLKLRDVTEKQINRLTSALKKLEFTPVFKEDFDKAQVTGGGVALEEIEKDSFSCKKYKNLYITGELLDVNGKCGGYNLTFAILSGIQAVEDIISRH